MTVVVFREKNIEIVQGSSDLLADGRLPVGTDRVSPMKDRVNASDYSNELVLEFIETFGDFRVKGGVLNNLEASVNKLMGITASVAKPIKEKVAKEAVKKPEQVVPAPISTREYEVVPPLADPIKELSVFNMLGSSATGKGTRMNTLLLYLIESVKLPYEIITFKGFAPQTHGVGYYFPSLKAIFFGKFVKSNKGSRLLSWSSHDWLYSVTSGGMRFYDLALGICNCLDATTIVYEGYPAMAGAAHTRKLFGAVENVKVFTQYFIYPLKREEGFDILQERVFGRSGKYIKGTCYNTNSGYPKVHEAHVKALEEGIIGGSSELLNYDAPVTSFGELFLNINGKSDYVEDFKTWAEENSILRNTDNPEANYTRLSRYIESQAPTVMVDAIAAGIVNPILGPLVTN